MLLILLITLTVLLVFYLIIRILPPLLYWKKRKIVYNNPITRLLKVLVSKKSLVVVLKEAYQEFPNERYYGSYQFLKPSLFVKDVDLIKQITIKDFDHFTDHIDILSGDSEEIFNKNLFTLKGKEWKLLRNTLSPAYTSAKMKLMFKLIMETSKNFTKHFIDLNENLIELEMKQVYTKYTCDIIANCAFGINCNSLKEPDNEFFLMAKEFTNSSPFRIAKIVLLTLFPTLSKIMNISAVPLKVNDFFKKIINDAVELREKEGIVRPDLIHLLIEAKKDQSKDEDNDNIKITNDIITAQALIFFFAGFETTSSLLSLISYELAKNQNVQKNLIEEIDKLNGDYSYDNIVNMKYLDQVISEGLRKWTPGFALNRVCTKEYTIQPKHKDEVPLTLSKGCFIMIPTVAIHYDSKYFPNPDLFDPDRFNDENKKEIVPGSYIPFGSGPRNCIGSRFALLEIKALLVCLLSNFEFEFIEKTPVPIKLKKTFALLVEGGTWLGLKQRK